MKDLQHDNLTKICMLRKTLFVVLLTLLVPIGSNFVTFFLYLALMIFFVHSEKGNDFLLFYTVNFFLKLVKLL